MTTEATSAPSQAEAKAQTSEVSDRAGNLSGAEAAARLLKMSEAKTPTADQTTTEQSEGATTPAAEEPQSASAEAQPAEGATEPKAETPEETEAKAEGEADDDLSNSTQIDAETRRKIARKIEKERHKRKQLEGTVNELKARVLEMQQAQPQTAQPTAPTPGEPALASVNDVAGLTKLAHEADAAIDYCDRVLDAIEDGAPPPDGWSKQALKEAKRNAERTKARDIPARLQFLQERHKSQQRAFQDFPFLKDRTTNEYLLAQQVRQQLPWVANHPQGDLIVGVQVEGLKALYARQEAAKKKAEEKPKPVSTAKPAGDQTAVSAAATTTRAPAAGAKAALAKATAELNAKGNVSGSDAAKFLMQRQHARNAR